MSNQDIRWLQRFANFRKALSQLSSAVSLANQRPLSDLEKQGIIQAFEFTYELAWNVLKDYFYHQGNPSITGSRDATREAFARGLVTDGDGWMEMIRSCNQTSHTYNQSVADEIVSQITKRYHALFQQLEQRLQELANG